MAKGPKAAELRAKTEAELKELVVSTKKELLEVRFQNYTNKLNDTSKIGRLRRELARVNTVLAEQRRAANAAKSEGQTQ